MSTMGGGAKHLNNLFSKGSQVEVSSDEDGFNGAWYIATVLEPPSSTSAASRKKIKTHHHPHQKNKKVVYVEYHSLLSDEDGSKPLREYSDVAFLRPSPPPDTALTLNLELHDVVDAYYRDGWWTGVITRILDNSNFVVTFQNPPDEIEFGISELRVHREWVDGKWVRPEKQRTAGLMFSAGKKVEVSFEKEDYRDVWFPATVVEDSVNGLFLVEYQRPGTDDEAGLHRVTVDFLHIRPSPPHLRDKNFVLLEKVDALYDFGWWSGVITRELADSRYIVFFKQTNKESEFSHSELRPHMKWKDGKWFSASQDVVGNNANGTETTTVRGESVTMKGDFEDRTPCALNSLENLTEHITPSTEKQPQSPARKTKLINLDTDDTNSWFSKNLQAGTMADSPSQLNIPSVEPNKETTSDFTSPTAAHSGTPSSLEAMVKDQSAGKTESLSHGKKMRSKRGKVGDLNSQTIDTARKKGRLANTEIRGLQASAQGDISDSAGKPSEGLVGKESILKEVSIPVVIGLASNGMNISLAKKPQKLPSKKSPQHTGGQTHVPVNNAGNGLEVGGESIQKRRRGRPPKLRAKSPETSMAVNQPNGDAAAHKMVVEDHTKNELGSPRTAGTESARKEGVAPDKEPMKLIGDGNQLLHGTPKERSTFSSAILKIPLTRKGKPPHEKIAQISSEQPMKQSSVRGKRGRRRTISVNNESSTQDSQDILRETAGEVLEKDLGTKKLELTVDGSMADDQPLSMWFEGMHSPSTVDCSGDDLGRTAELCSEASERQREVTLQTPSVDGNRDIVPAGSQSLPFVKNTPLWETIESMQVFRMIPQNPHFRPLDCFKESSREGLAIGNMVTFSSVVEKTSGLQFDNPRSMIEDCLETLVELESHGFDVKVVRNRLTGLLLIKDRQEELQEQSNGLRSRIVEHNLEKCKFDKEIDEIDKQIRELQEKRALAMSMKESKDSEITALESSVGGIGESINNTRLEFDSLAATPW